MLSRPSSIFLAFFSLGLGLGLGFAMGRGTPMASAQVRGTDGPRASQVDAVARPRGDSTARGEDSLYDGLRREYEQFRHVNRMFEDVARAVSPSVVHIVAEKSRPSGNPRTPKRVERFEETGSGVIVRSAKSAGLFVLTNHHVVEGGKLEKIRIHLMDGRSVIPEQYWSDAKADIAVLKLSRSDLPAARLGNSNDLAVGTWVLAMGSPFGLMHSVSQGIISARGRHMEELADVENQDFLQTDAAINPGNSGGPLVNMKGEVIGINNSIASTRGGNEGVGFSIPINLARWIMDELIVNGKVTRGALGVDLQPDFRQDDANNLGLDRPRGAWIGQVHADSPAFRAGLQDGDVVLRFGDVDIIDINHLINTVSMTPIGVPCDVVVWRDRHEVRLHVTVGERDRTLSQVMPQLPGRMGNDPSGLIRRPNLPDATRFVMGLQLATLDPELARRHRLPEDMKGAIVVTVDPEGRLGNVCRTNDVISSINEQPIETADQAAHLLSMKPGGGNLVISIDRQAGDGFERHNVRVPE